jgi:hypothetical protein
MPNPRDAVDAALKSKLDVTALTTLATGDVHNITPPPGTAPPYTVYAYESDTHRFMYDKREWQLVYRVQNFVPGQWPKNAAAMDAVVDTLLTETPLTLAGFTWVNTERESGLDLPPQPGQSPIYMVGSRFRITVDEAF